MVSALDPGSNGPGLSPGRAHCVMFLIFTAAKVLHQVI